MAHVASPHPHLSVEEYLEFEKTSSVRHEYVGGYIYALAGATDRHHEIITNISGHLWLAARGGPCRVYTEFKLRAADDIYYYPDVLVSCDPDDRNPQYRTHLCVVVEVLSPSTAATDRREKLFVYRQIPSLMAYIMVYQDEVRVERHYRGEYGQWENAEVMYEGIVPFPCPEVKLTLADIYEGL